MITPESTIIANLGPRSIPAPPRLVALHSKGAGHFVPDDARVRYQVEEGTGADLPGNIFFEKAGPREKLFFDPATTRAAIMTCGGVCPGLNNVIRSTVLELHYNYGVKKILGIRYGYAGLNPQAGLPPIELNPDIVSRIHEEGGTMLGTSRGPQPRDVMVDFLVAQGINILFCVGGDGTLHGAHEIAAVARKRGLPIAVVGVPKTIDNDVMYITRTFGVVTAIERARDVLESAHNEARSAFNGVGLVKVMGRDAGFIAVGATLASQDVNFCLIPEVPFALEGPGGFFEALRRYLANSRHAVVVVAEGAGQEHLQEPPGGKDASGNKRQADIGVFLKEQITAWFKKNNTPVEVKYFDPSYFIRSAPANCDDAILCDQLARKAVHAAMAGKTDMVIGQWNGQLTHLPIALAISEKKHVNPEGALWTSVLAATGQPQRFV
jgi:6-phosphofructokinase 1